MTVLIIIAVVALIVGCAGLYIRKEKKKGTRCIGCPNGCDGNCSSCSNH